MPYQLCQKKVKAKEKALSAKTIVKNARKELLRAKTQYLNKPTRNALKIITKAQNKLDEHTPLLRQTISKAKSIKYLASTLPSSIQPGGRS